MLKAKTFQFIQIKPDNANVREVIEFCGVPWYGISTALIQHEQGTHYKIHTESGSVPLEGLDNSFIIRTEDEVIHIMSESLFRQLFDVLQSDDSTLKPQEVWLGVHQDDGGLTPRTYPTKKELVGAIGERHTHNWNLMPITPLIRDSES